jgi:type IV pilus assembly protein PilC
MLQQVEHGYSVDEVRERFASQGYLVYWVKPQGFLSGAGVGRGRGRLKQANFLVFNQQFLTLLKAGLPILNSLDLLIKRQKDAYLKQLLENVRERVKEVSCSPMRSRHKAFFRRFTPPR